MCITYRVNTNPKGNLDIEKRGCNLVLHESGAPVEKLRGVKNLGVIEKTEGGGVRIIIFSF